MITRWTYGRKVKVVLEVRNGIFTIPEACEHYDIGEYELRDWIFKHGHFGPSSLRTCARKANNIRIDDEIAARQKDEHRAVTA